MQVDKTWTKLNLIINEKKTIIIKQTLNFVVIIFCL